jgi:c-di-GMP-binding flagellar brake protein YcgR
VTLILFRVDATSNVHHLDFNKIILILKMHSTKKMGSILTNDGRCTCEIKCRIAMAKAAFNKKRNLFTST